MYPVPTLAQVEQWEQLLSASYPEMLVDVLSAPEQAVSEWAGMFAGMKCTGEHSTHTAVIVQAYAQWLLGIMPLLDTAVVTHVDMVFPVLIGIREKLTLANAEAIIAGYLRFIYEQPQRVAAGSTDDDVSLLLAGKYTDLLAEKFFIGELST